MDWKDRKQNFQKQPPDKKYRPKYIAKDQLPTYQPPKPQQPPPHPQFDDQKPQPHTTNPNKRPYQKPKPQYIQKPKYIQKPPSTQSLLPCLICSQYINKRESIWTCQNCYISLHLKCIKQWIKKTNQDHFEFNQNKKKIIFNWNCIQCKIQFHQIIPEYYCFCGKFKNPEPDRDLEPHSCGKPCQRKRGPFCPHLCSEICHSGKCKPCQFQGTLVKCNCQKTQRLAKCSQQRIVFQCGKKCQKLLKCGKHRCQRNCHYDQCYPCKKKHLVTCYCGKTQDIVDCIEKSFACQKICSKMLNCGFHQCQKDCHQGPCGICKKSPQYQKTCPGGHYQLLTISQLQRQSCRDPIPSCCLPCKKKLPCGHQCTQICHDGRCPDCKIIVQQFCRCGTVQRKIQCHKTKIIKQQFLCETICKKKRNCGIHTCNTVCCKFKGLIGPQAHQCELTCQKILNCQKHTCDLPCHPGNCKKCPVIYSQPQPCPCGATSLKPPIVCGTITPQCQNICHKLMSCGHKCLQYCHYGICLCRQQVQVVCRCGGSKIKTVCGRQALCLTKCQKLLQCNHKCLVQCHSGPCKQSHKDGCFKKCDKDRLDCGHKCKQICHLGKKCEQFPCQAQILIKCQCGHRQSTILCTSQSTTQPSLKKKQILCNKKCQNMKRFDIIYKGKQIFYPNILVQYAFKNLPYLLKIQQKLEKFISESDDHFIQIPFKPINDNTAKIALHNLFQNHYHLNTHFYRHMKTALFTLTQTQHTMLPKPFLSQYIQQISKGNIKRSNLPFQYTIKFDIQSKQKTQNIISSLKPYLHKYYIQKKDKMILIHFWSKYDGLQVQNYLQNQHLMIHFIGQDNLNKVDQLHQDIQFNQIIETDIKNESNQQQQKQKNKSPPPDQNPLQSTKQTPTPSLPITQNSIQPDNKKQDNKKQSKQQQKSDQKPQPDQKQKLSIKSLKQPRKVLIKTTVLNFTHSQYPPSSENVQDIYLLDNDELFGDIVDWNQIVQELNEKKMGIQASEWRIRAFLIISTFHPIAEKILTYHLSRILSLYQKDKQKAHRLLQIQRLQTKKIQQQMKSNLIYLSDNQPQITSYAILSNYFALDKIQFKVTDECSQTTEIQRALQIIQCTQKCNYQQFYTIFCNSQYLLSCAMIPFVTQIRQNCIKQLKNHVQIPTQHLFKFLLFQTQQNLLHYLTQNGIKLDKKKSKSRKIQQYILISSEQKPQFYRQMNFKSLLDQKRNKKYFFTEPTQLIHDKWMTRSFFAFGDFKQTKNSKYMLNLCKNLKQN